MEDKNVTASYSFVLDIWLQIIFCHSKNHPIIMKPGGNF